MATTQADYDALKAALDSGVLTVKYQDKQVTYRSQEEMERRLFIMGQDLGISPTQKTRTTFVYSKGL